MTGRVDDVDRDLVTRRGGVVDRRVLGEDRDAFLPLEVHRVHDSLADITALGLMLGEHSGLPEHGIDQWSSVVCATMATLRRSPRCLIATQPSIPYSAQRRILWGPATATERVADAASPVGVGRRSDQSDPAAGPARRRRHELRRHQPHSVRALTAPAMPMTVALGSQCAGRPITSAPLML